MPGRGYGSSDTLVAVNGGINPTERNPVYSASSAWKWRALFWVPILAVNAFIWTSGIGWPMYAGGLLLVVPICALDYWLIGSRLTGRVGVIPRRVADALTGFDEAPVFPTDPAHLAPPVAGVTTGFGSAAGSMQPADTYFSTHAAPTDWADLVRSAAGRIGAALGDGFEAHADGYDLVLSHGTSVRRVPLAAALQPPPAEEQDRVVRACLKMLEAAQGFRHFELNHRWPERPLSDELLTAEPSAPIPRVHVANGEIRLGYGDELGMVVEMPPIPWHAGRQNEGDWSVPSV